MSIKLLILADDLTGAADTAVQCVKHGSGAALWLGTGLPELEPGIGVLAIDTETRHRAAIDAFRKVTALVHSARAAGVVSYYKKIDSTFRGNAGAELEALMQAACSPQLMLVPAYPRGGRITRGGRQYVHGRPLHESPFARDLRDPVTESFIPAILGKQTPFPVHVIDRDAFAGFDAHAERRPGIFVFDAETDDDLVRIGKKLAAGNKLTALAGAAGFAAVASEFLPLPLTASAMPRFHDRLFIVNGSRNEVSLEQVARARQAGVFCAFLHAEMIEPGARAPSGKDEAIVASLIQQLHMQGRAMLSVPFQPLPGSAPDACAFALGRITAAVLEQVPDSNVALFGGDTAYAVCKANDICLLFPQAEIQPGLTVCTAGLGAGVRAVMLKSGGFGSEGVIDVIGRYILSSGQS
ncbi:MAG: hypothetical protein JW768_08365 [Chitinispirillaceae bacterium]|nr:hypothetical protein [Chitinispirillaceae bacterium]